MQTLAPDYEHRAWPFWSVGTLQRDMILFKSVYWGSSPHAYIQSNHNVDFNRAQALSRVSGRSCGRSRSVCPCWA